LGSSYIEGNFLATLDLAPSLAERVRTGKQEGRLLGTASLPGFFRKPYGPGWALVGDAGLHVDPITASGISNAFRDADLLATAIHDGLSGTRPIDDAMAAYEQTRNEAFRPLYGLTAQLASLQPPPPELAALLGRLPGNQEATDKFFGVIEGTVPVQDFFAPVA
jgi:flavin-dependent dehydrogenase